MQYLPGKGLNAYRENIKFWSNVADRNLNISLATSPSLTDTNGANAIPLSVTVNGTELTTTAKTLTFDSLFPAGITNGSSAVSLMISQTNPGSTVSSGRYSGIVSLVVTQATATGTGS